MTAWLIAPRDRPIAERERHGALAATAAVLLAATVLLAVTRPTTPHTPTRHATATSTPPQGARPSSVEAGDVFLAGYLAYAYGHAPASQIRYATPALIVSLAAHQPRVPPGMRARQPRVLELRATPAPAGLLGVRAVVNDGGLIDYPVGLLLAFRGGRLLVTGLEN